MSESFPSFDSKKGLTSRRDAQGGAAARYEMRKKQRERNRETRAGKLTVACLTKKMKILNWLVSAT